MILLHELINKPDLSVITENYFSNRNLEATPENKILFDCFSGLRINEISFIIGIIHDNCLFSNDDNKRHDAKLFITLMTDMIITLDKMRYFIFCLEPLYDVTIHSFIHFPSNDLLDIRINTYYIRKIVRTLYADDDYTQVLCRDFEQLAIDLYDNISRFVNFSDYMNRFVIPEEEERANPYHDEKGRFCSGGNAVFISEWATKVNEENEDSPPSTLTSEQKSYYKSKLKCSDELVAFIRNKQEAEIYVKAGLREETIDGRKCLVRDDIDLDYVEDGKSNRDLMNDGNAPYTSSGEVIELHHIGQKNYSPLAQLTGTEHRGKKNTKFLHDVLGNSTIDRNAFDSVKDRHWIDFVKRNDN